MCPVPSTVAGEETLSRNIQPHTRFQGLPNPDGAGLQLAGAGGERHHQARRGLFPSAVLHFFSGPSQICLRLNHPLSDYYEQKDMKIRMH